MSPIVLALLLLGAPAPAARPAPARAQAPAPAPGASHLERGADGLELLVREVPDARVGSLRVLFRSGGADDPPGKDGLAHLVEHLVAVGDGPSLLGFQDQARAAGATVNAHTSQGWTRYELDAPAAAFPALAERFLRLVTNPQWDAASVRRQRGVLRTEADYHERSGLLDLVDRAVFPAPAQGGTLVGSEDSRERLDAAAARAFFAQRYRPDRATVILTGPVTVAWARGLVRSAWAIPPPEAAPPAAEQEPPSLPQQQRLQAGLTLAMLGFRLEPEDRGICVEVAALLELRLRLALELDGPRVSRVAVECPVLRGVPFMVALAYTSTLDGGDLPADLGRAFRGLAERPPDLAERSLVDARLARRRARLLGDPAALADWLSERAAPAPGTPPEGLLPGALPPAARLRELAGRSVRPERQVLLSLSPLQN